MRWQPIELQLKYSFGAFGGNNSSFKCTHFQLQCIDPIQVTKLHKSKISVHFMNINTCSYCNSKRVHWVYLGILAYIESVDLNLAGHLIWLNFKFSS